MLVIHSKDPSTEFIKVLYEGCDDVHLINEYTSSKDTRHALSHVHLGETIMFLGHVHPDGLFALEENG